MRIALLTPESDFLYLAGDETSPERTFSSAFDIRIDGKIIIQTVRNIRRQAARHIDRGNLETTLSFSTIREFATPALAEAFAATYDESQSLSGILALFSYGPEDVQAFLYMANAVVTLPQLTVSGCAVTLRYEARGGFVFEWTQTSSTQQTGYRITTTTTDKWWEVSFVGPTGMTGSAATGYFDAATQSYYALQWSEDLIHWDLGKYTDCAGSPTDIGGGLSRYWCRSIYSIDTKVKTGHMWVEFSESFPGDYRNNPLNALTIKSIVQLLGRTFTMPTDAAALQTKLRELGFEGATVVAVSDVVWRIDLYGVNYVAYGTTNKIYWPQYLVADIYGVINSPVNGQDFKGEFVNADGLRCTLPKQFARLSITYPTP